MTDILSAIAELRRDMRRSEPPLIMTPSECAEVIGVTEDTLLHWRKDAMGPPYSKPTSRCVRYLRDDVVAWLEEHRNG
ncbi:AlpA family transcriptional regulator [Roseobacter sp. OBYS 0001]|uniref:helix-turn-helix transcriptional regulator n=1 Tax=Roseobacter sp. OBYS 0001 TaxID=882651 RepID=UPI001BC26550|nr:helix-turn-helix domain-containing protein [Roseobacter sp. OBYS 0001]GIT86175.1 hypothetical protein ROBYS_11910 [Roseobacter sp. OBYS 0001]